ncbi:DUF2510 domain-containing protein [Nocardioides sp. TRM66260-LWL]|uniref:DUF2510 domain-containing protein n=1 Tax=Nocardioides sp. TRM66260-LWL TaxID=2874478 RepID=UPI001CC4188A|nr:DUF2510 domain-containing protein [Nocardioides sp. TRM66260-LWL]MBZ5735638.1 DUF2510 domain-containing protein [Nocardioides sp. TRM66260-LWL]
MSDQGGRVPAGPGSYLDPEERTRLRWWDGQAWTEQRQVKPSESAPGAQILSLSIVLVALLCVLAGLSIAVIKALG